MDNKAAGFAITGQRIEACHMRWIEAADGIQNAWNTRTRAERLPTSKKRIITRHQRECPIIDQDHSMLEDFGGRLEMVQPAALKSRSLNKG